jgi:LCP family protein required for cell wall assembly
VLSVFLLVTFGVYWWKYHAFSSGLNRLNIFGSSAQTKTGHDIDGKDQNILIVGNDDRSTASDAELQQLGTTRDGGSLNTDTMMIVHVPADGTKATLISLPRDSYVDIPGYGKDKLNAAYTDAYTHAGGTPDQKRAAGGALLVQTIQGLTGLQLDHFVQVDLLGFYRISLAIGPVQVNMCAAVKEPDSGIDLKKGVNSIQGTQALAFVRQRYNFPNGLGDLDRVERQRYFLTATFRKLTSAGTLLNPSKLQRLLTAVQKSVYMDSGLDPRVLAEQMINLSADNIVGQTIPTDGFGASSTGASVLLVTPSKVQQFVNALVGNTDKALAAAKPVAPSSVTVDVRNAGSGVNGMATTSANLLRSKGFVVASADDASTSASTVIQYADGMQAQAKTLAAYVPGATMQKVASIGHVTLLLGADGKTVKLPATSTPSATATSGTTSSPSSTAPKPKPIDAGCIN